MRIRVDEIPESGRFLHFHWDNDRLNQFLPPDDPFELELARPINVDLEIQRRADHIRVLGNIKGVLQVACHRCLNPFPWPLDEKVDLFLVEEQKAPEEEEIELDEDALEYEFFDGQTIDIDQLVAEQLFLSLPFKVVCSDDCRGLCPNCGANLNEEPCKCDKNAKGSAFAALEEIKTQLPGSDES
jgi:uncharacterized protein